MKVIRLGIAGLGTVAQGVLEILHHNHKKIADRSGFELQVVRVASRTAKPDVDLLGAEFTTDLGALIADDVDVVVELIGGEGRAKTLIEEALAAGKGVATANKAVIANYGAELFASNAVTPLKFEAAVAGAIPIIQAIQQGLVANDFYRLVGIINGTCNYILTAMQEEGTQFTDALATAQALGYAEADPSFDVDGIDAGHKLAILAGLGFDGSVDFSELHVEGITGVTGQDIRYAKELGFCIKHVGIAKVGDDNRIEARVHPALIPENTLFANVAGVTNAVLVDSDAAGQTLFSGPGAGGSATASAVVADVVALGQTDRIGGNGNRPKLSLLPIAEVVCENYLRIPVRDQPGVFADVASALSNHGISIEAAIQKGATDEVVSIVILTGSCVDHELTQAMAEVSELTQIAGEIARIRVENLG
ncbi:MAG: homoserine dehydrogenase [Limisphaerales bacterium]|jgi:homoserine dehydrogenase